MKTKVNEHSDGDQGVRVILVTFPNLDSARQVGTLLVDSQVVACVNLVPGVESIYRWEGKVNIDKEILAVIKTTEALVPEVEALIHEKHPYETPEFLVIKPDSGSQAYLDWVVKVVS